MQGDLRQGGLIMDRAWPRFSARRILSLLLCAATPLLLPPAAPAEQASGPCAAIMDPNNAPISDPRLDHLLVAGTHVNVLVPPRYQATQRRYPVIYLFHGAFGDHDSFSTQTDLIAFTASLPDGEQAIVVMPDGGHLPAGRDWVDGTHHQASFVIGTLLPYVDTHYRTRASRGHRAAAGFSAGGMNAMVFAARHPELFAAAGSFSGFVDQFTQSGRGIIELFAELDNELCGATNNPAGLWGDPVAHPMGWIGHDPTYLAPNLGNTTVYATSGNGQPCPGDPPLPDPDSPDPEAIILEMTQNFDLALRRADVRHVTEFRPCGLHQFANASRDLRRFWPMMLDAFDRDSSDSFEYRSGEAIDSAWGWTFSADPTRAAEFLDVRSASVRGLHIRGSGVESILTAPLFHPGQGIIVDG